MALLKRQMEGCSVWTCVLLEYMGNAEGGGIEAVPVPLLELHITNGYCPVLRTLGAH